MEILSRYNNGRKKHNAPQQQVNNNFGTFPKFIVYHGRLNFKNKNSYKQKALQVYSTNRAFLSIYSLENF